MKKLEEEKGIVIRFVVGYRSAQPSAFWPTMDCDILKGAARWTAD